MAEPIVYTFNVLQGTLSVSEGRFPPITPVSYVLLSDHRKIVELTTQLKAENAELKKQIEELYTEQKELNRATEIEAQQSMLQAELDVLNKKIQKRASKVKQ